jgi:predicted transcriptional regulator
MSEKKLKTQIITIEEKQGTFSAIFNKFKGEKNPEKSDLAILRSLLTDQKAKLLHVLKTKQPNSLYELAKLLAKDFKSVRQDVLLLEKMGLIELIPVHKGKREKLKPLLVIDSLEIKIVL